MIDRRARDALSAVAQVVERATDEPSKQPRFQQESGGFGSVLYFARMAEMEAPNYSTNSMQRDQWLRNVWRLEPRLAGVVNSVVLVDSNRGWTLTGGRNQVRRYTTMLHEADGGLGWRQFARKTALSYWTTDVGSITEFGRDGNGGPLRAIYHVDSARCRLTGDYDYPLSYYPPTGGAQEWGAADYFRCTSLPNDDETFHGLGFCAVSRAVELVRLMYAVMCHDQEQVAARAPKGLLLLHGISEQQWVDSLETRKNELDGMERQYYGGVQVLASAGMDTVDAKLIALSQLPQGFDAQTFMDLTMYGYALSFGYDPREFWPVSGGSLGTGRETEVQHRKATGKGGMEFALSLAEGLGRQLPPTLAFEFEQRDDEGELQNAAVQSAKLGVVATAYQAGLMQGASLLTREEARILLAEAGLIPPEWTQSEEDVTSSDTEEAESEGEETPASTEEAAPTDEIAQRALDSEPVRRAMVTFPREVIEQHCWPSKRVKVLRVPRRHLWPVSRESKVLYSKGGVTITQADVDKAIKKWDRDVPELAGLLNATVVKA